MFLKKQPSSSESIGESIDQFEDNFMGDDDQELVESPELEESQAAQGSAIARPTKPSIISEGFEFVGNIISEGALNISGVVKGKISAKSVLVDVGGQVEGELTSETLVVKGKIVGQVSCQDLNVGPRAFIDGIISYQNIHIQRGGKVAGKFNKN